MFQLQNFEVKAHFENYEESRNPFLCRACFNNKLSWTAGFEASPVVAIPFYVGHVSTRMNGSMILSEQPSWAPLRIAIPF